MGTILFAYPSMLCHATDYNGRLTSPLVWSLPVILFLYCSFTKEFTYCPATKQYVWLLTLKLYTLISISRLNLAGLSLLYCVLTKLLKYCPATKQCYVIIFSQIKYYNFYCKIKNTWSLFLEYFWNSWRCVGVQRKWNVVLNFFCAFCFDILSNF